MSILITGGAGYIGSHMAHHLLGAGEDIVVLDNLSTGVERNLPRNIPFVRGDIADPALVSGRVRTGSHSTRHSKGQHWLTRGDQMG